MLPSFDHTIQVILALTPLGVALIGAAVAIAQMRVAGDKKKAADQKQAAGEAAEPPVAVGVTAPTPVDDDHADEAIAVLRESRDDWKQVAGEYRGRLTQANATLQQHGLPTA